MSTATPPKPARRRRHWLVRSGVGVAVFVGLWIAAVGYETWRMQRAFQEACAEADRLDPGWRGDDIAAARKDLPDERNSYFRARAAITRQQTRALLGKDKKLDDEYKQTLPQHQHTKRVITALRERIAMDGPALADALAVADCPEGWIPPPTSPLILSKSPGVPVFDILNLVRDLLFPQYVLQIEDGDFDAALVTLRAIIFTSRPLADSQNLLNNLMATAVRSFATHGVDRMLAQGEPPAAVLSELQKHMEQEVGRSLLPAFRGDRALNENTIRALDDGRLSQAELLRIVPGPDRTGWPTVDAWINRILGNQFDRANCTAMVRYYTWTIERLKESPDSLIERADEWAAQREHMTGTVKATATNMSPYVVEMAINGAKFRCAVAALAAEQFRQVNGRWPTTLDELLPTYLTAVPRDPFASQPMRLVRLADGIVIYSIGEDKIDDAGNVLSGQTKGRDLGFRVWDVDQRGQRRK